MKQNITLRFKLGILIFFGILNIPNNMNANSFVENRGQVTSLNEQSTKDILYTAESNGKKIFIAKDGFYFQNIVPIHDSIATVECIKLQFLNTKDEIIGIGKGQKKHLNHYYNQNGAFENVKSFDTVVLKNLYDNIDAVCYLNKKGEFKYDLYIKDYQSTPDIKFTYLGVKKISLTQQGAAIIIATNSGDIIDRVPLSYNLNNNQLIKAKYRIHNNIISYDVTNYPSNNDVIIDPVLIWATYFGGSNSDNFAQVKTDNDENVYAVGTTTSNSGIATIGTHQIFISSLTDAFVTKFDSLGNRIWATYYGGNDYDYGKSLSIQDSINNIYVVGETRSYNGIATQGSFIDTIYQVGNSHGFLVKFNSNGLRSWGTYIGESKFGTYYYESANGVAVDYYGNAYVVGNVSSTSSVSNLFATTHQTVFGGGSSDGFIFKISPTGSRVWSTLYGGNKEDTLTSVTIDGNGDILACGHTNSTTNIAYNGSGSTNVLIDGLLVKFNANGTRIWGSYYSGNGNDRLTNIICRGTTIYASGTTDSYANISYNGHQNSKGGGISATTDAFCIKLLGNSFLQWGTYYGGSKNDYGNGIAVDSKGNVFLSGITSSQDSNEIGFGGFASNMGVWSNKNTFLVKFDSIGIRKWGTYYSWGVFIKSSTVAVSKQNKLFLCGDTEWNQNTATPGAYQTLLNGSGTTGPSDGFIARFDDINNNYLFSTYSSQPLCPNTQYKVPYSTYGIFSPYVFYVELSDINGAFSNPIVVGFKSTQNGNISIFIPDTITPGNNYKLRIKATNPNMSIVIDSNITIYPPVNAYTFPTGKDTICNGDTITIQAFPNSNVTYKWYKNNALVSGSNSSNYMTSLVGQYNVVITDNNGCVDTSSNTNIAIQAVPNLGFIHGNSSTTLNSYGTYYVNNIAGAKYIWTVNGGVITSTPTDTSFVSIKWTSSGNNSVSVYITKKCSDTLRLNVLVSAICSAKYKLYPDLITQHNWYAVNQAVGNPPITYTWTWGDGSSSGGAIPSHIYAAPGNYKICLSITDFNGCTSSYCDSSTYVYKTDAQIVTVNCVLQLPNGINDIQDNNQVLIYPNPAFDKLHIQTNQDIDEIYIYNYVGQIVKTFKQTVNNEIDISQLETGIYIAEIKLKTGIARVKWEKQ